MTEQATVTNTSGRCCRDKDRESTDPGFKREFQNLVEVDREGDRIPKWECGNRLEDIHKVGLVDVDPNGNAVVSIVDFAGAAVDSLRLATLKCETIRKNPHGYNLASFVLADGRETIVGDVLKDGLTDLSFGVGSDSLFIRNEQGLLSEGVCPLKFSIEGTGRVFFCCVGRAGQDERAVRIFRQPLVG